MRLHRAGLKHFHHPAVGDLALHYEVLPVSADEGQTITVFTAEPGSPTADALPLLASLRATNRTDDSVQRLPAGTTPIETEDERTF